jgi:hypothetical protein
VGHSVDDVDRALDFNHHIDVSFHLLVIMTGAERSDHEATPLDHLFAGFTQLSAGILFHGGYLLLCIIVIMRRGVRC